MLFDWSSAGEHVAGGDEDWDDKGEYNELKVYFKLLNHIRNKNSELIVSG